jgi:L-lactate dehydrogenase complex protein LldG
VAADDARAAVLARVRAALGDVPAEEGAGDVEVPRAYARTLEAGIDPLELFARRVAEYQATVHRVGVEGLPAALAEACARHAARRVVVAPGVPVAWRPPGVELLEDDGLAPAVLDAADGVLTGCAGAVALTGTFALDGGERSGRRAITLLPDLHLCVVEAAQVCGTVGELLERIGPGRPVTLVSGPSATSDIELNRVEGVHGPRRLEVFLVG